MVLLEDMKGGVARDKLGRPIFVMFGMLYGTHLEQQKIVICFSKRAAKYCQPGTIMNSGCMIIEVNARKGAQQTFRFPDKKTKALMDLGKEHFPGSLTSSTHFCGVPSAIIWAFPLTKPFMEEEAYNNMIFHSNYNRLTEYISPDNLLKEWGGHLDFNVDDYIKWRAEEEGVSHSFVRNLLK